MRQQLDLKPDITPRSESHLGTRKNAPSIEEPELREAPQSLLPQHSPNGLTPGKWHESTNDCGMAKDDLSYR